jgi:hypothetical protein
MKPVMGYPSQTAAIRALRAQGMGCAEIARLLGMKLKDVTSAAITATKHRPKSFALTNRSRCTWVSRRSLR